MTIGIYCITERATGRCYIGQSKHIEKRWKVHYKKFPLDLFSYAIIRTVTIPAFMNSFERHYIRLYDSHCNGFNQTIGGSNIRATHPDAETRAKLSAAGIGRKHSDETKAKMAAAKTGQKGKPLTEEHRAKQSASLTGKPKSAETRARMSAARTKRWKLWRQDKENEHAPLLCSMQ